MCLMCLPSLGDTLDKQSAIGTAFPALFVTAKS